MKEYITANNYCKKIFGTKVYKIALSASNSCPNRDGTKSTGGCIFCSQSGSGDFACGFEETIPNQIERAKKLISFKSSNCKYIAYFQSFTGTYGDINLLREKYFQAVSQKDIVGILIATRPDCITDEVLEMLAELNKKTVLWVELGLQTINPATAEYINRCYDLSEYDLAVKKLRKVCSHIITHIILGLPGETKQDMIDSVRYVCDKTDGIKLQLLYVIRGTKLEKDYLDKKFRTLDLDEYCDILCDCIEVLPNNMVVHRITGDGAKKDLIAPMWSANKKQVLSHIQKAFARRQIKIKTGE